MVRAAAVAALVPFLALCPPLWAQDAPVAPRSGPTVPVATLDQDALFLQSQYGLRVQRELGADRQALEDENRRIEGELIAEEQALTTARATLDAATFAAKADEFDQRVQRIRAEQDDKALGLQRRFEQERQRFLSLIGPALIEVLQDNGASVLLSRDAVIFAVDGVDITERAIATIDAMIGTGAAEGLKLPMPDTETESAD
jgi:Skp family chaperone for outer membrane proteins